MNRRDSLAILAAAALGGYLAVSAFRSDRSSTNSLDGARTAGPGTYGAEGYGRGGYGE